MDDRWVDVSHEALIRGWPRLRGWIDEDRAGLRLHRHLTQDVQAWEELKRDEQMLYRGARLVQALEWSARNDAAMNDAEREFLSASVTLRDREQTARERQVRRRILGLTGGFAVAIALAAVALVQQRQAIRQEAAARSRQLAAQSAQALDASEDGLERSALLALESLRADWTMEAYEILSRALDLLPPPAVHTWTLPGSRVQSIAVSPDSRFLGAGTADGSVVIWSLPSGEVRLRDPLRLGPVYSMAFSPDGNWMVAGFQNEARIWNTATWREVTKPGGDSAVRLQHEGMVWSLVFGPEGKRMVTANNSPVLRVYRTSDWTLIDSTLGMSGPVFDATYDRVHGWFAIATLSSFSLLDTAMRSVASESYGSTGIAFSPDGMQLATAGNDGVHTWNILKDQHGLVRLVLDTTGSLPPGDGMRSVAISPDGHLLVTTPFPQSRQAGLTTTIWDRATRRERTRMVATSAAFSSDGRWLATGQDNTVQLRDPTVRKELIRLTHRAPVRSLAFTPNDRDLIASASADGIIQVFRSDSAWTRVKTLTTGADASTLRFSPHGQWLIAIGGRVLRVFDAISWRELVRAETDREIQDGALSADSRWLVVRGRDIVQVFETGTWRPSPAMSDSEPVDSLALSPDGEWLATWADQPFGHQYAPVTRVWSLATGEMVARLAPEGIQQVYTKGVTLGRTELAQQTNGWPRPTPLRRDSRVASPDGRWVAALDQGHLQVFDAVASRMVASLDTSNGDSDVAISPDSRWLAMARDSAVLVWPLASKDIIAQACARLSRNLSDAEWSRYRPAKGGPRPTCNR